jgi:hypothetical protein
MHRLKLLLVVALTVLVSACTSIGATQPNPGKTPNANGPYAYISFGVAGLVYLYSRPDLHLSAIVNTGKSSISSGLAYIDKQGRLLVNPFEAGPIDVYSPPYSGATQHIKLPKGLRPFLLFESDDGRLFVGAMSLVNGAIKPWLVTTRSPLSPNAQWSSIPNPATMQVAQLVVDSTGDLFVGFCCNFDGTSVVERFAPPYRQGPTLSIPLLRTPYALNIDSRRNLIIVTNDAGKGRIYLVPPPYTGRPLRAKTATQALSSAAISSNGRVFMTAIASVLMYDPPYKHLSLRIPLAHPKQLLPYRIAVDESDNLYVLSKTESLSALQQFELIEYPPPYTSPGSSRGVQADAPHAFPGLLGLQS